MARIAFIQEEQRTRFGIMILSAVLKSAGHQCEVFIDEKSEDLAGDVIQYRPDLISLSTMTPGITFALDMAKKLREKSDALIIMGGPHPTFYPEVIEEDCLDIICIGEGEGALRELADAIDAKSDFTGIQNLWVKKDGTIHKNELRDLVDVESLPPYDRELYYTKFQELRDAPTKQVFITRGCPFSCTYCFNHSLKKMYRDKGSFVRYQSVGKAIAEIKDLNDRYGMKWLQIIGDTINTDKKWFTEFLTEYKKTFNMPFLLNVRVDLVDEDMVRLMKEAGCERVDYAIENGDEWIRRNILKRMMSNETIVTNGKLFNKYHIRVQTSNIIGVPHETIETVFRTIEVNRQVQPESAHCFILQPYPKTEINEYALKNGFLDEHYDYSKSTMGFQIDFGGSPDFIPLKMEHQREMVNLLHFFNCLIHHPWTEPVVRQLIKLPPNRFFKAIYIYPTIRQDIRFTNSWGRKCKSAGRFFRILIIGS
jgi:anaerobic magnesium-protoporphyrin IX monomethyl ester cyclase